MGQIAPVTHQTLGQIAPVTHQTLGQIAPVTHQTLGRIAPVDRGGVGGLRRRALGPKSPFFQGKGTFFKFRPTKSDARRPIWHAACISLLARRAVSAPYVASRFSACALCPWRWSPRVSSSSSSASHTLKEKVHFMRFKNSYAASVAAAVAAVVFSAAFQPAEAVIITTANSGIYDVITTSDAPPYSEASLGPAITYAALSSGSWGDYSYVFANSSLAAEFATLYNASSAPSTLKTANNGTLGAKPSNPNTTGGPLFFTGTTTQDFGFGTLLTAEGQYYNGAANNFGSSQGGTGVFIASVPQTQVWALYKAQPVPEPTQMVSVAGIGAAYGAWRLRKLRRSRTAAGDAIAG